MHLLSSAVRIQPVRRSGTVLAATSADGWDGVLKPVVARYKKKVSRIYFHADAGFANPDVYEFLEAEGIKYAIRLPANSVLQGRIAYLLTRPIGRPPNEVRRYYANFTYQAGTWTKPRRVVAKVEWHPGELYPRVEAFGGAIFVKARSNASPVSSMPSPRAASMNRSDCALSVNFGFFALGFADFAIWPLGVIKFLPVMEYKPVPGRSCGRHDR
jgi:Transposase DDE domain group 1